MISKFAQEKCFVQKNVVLILKCHNIVICLNTHDRVAEWERKVEIQNSSQAGNVYSGEAARQIQEPAALIKDLQMNPNNPLGLAIEALEPNAAAFNEIVDLVTHHFNDKWKASAWLIIENPGLGGLSPMALITAGRGAKVLAFVKASLAENER